MPLPKALPKGVCFYILKIFLKMLEIFLFFYFSNDFDIFILKIILKIKKIILIYFKKLLLLYCDNVKHRK
jgi:hypothetical protein